MPPPFCFGAGDRLELEFGMSITTEKIIDWHPEFNNLKVSHAK